MDSLQKFDPDMASYADAQTAVVDRMRMQLKHYATTYRKVWDHIEEDQRRWDMINGKL